MLLPVLSYMDIVTLMKCDNKFISNKKARGNGLIYHVII